MTDARALVAIENQHLDELVQLLVERIQAKGPSIGPGAHFSARSPELLTAREYEVARLVLTGASNKQVARFMGISPRTVEVHRLRVMRKLGAVSAIHLARLLFQAGLTPDERIEMVVVAASRARMLEAPVNP